MEKTLIKKWLKCKYYIKNSPKLCSNDSISRHIFLYCLKAAYRNKIASVCKAYKHLAAVCDYIVYQGLRQTLPRSFMLIAIIGMKANLYNMRNYRKIVPLFLSMGKRPPMIDITMSHILFDALFVCHAIKD